MKNKIIFLLLLPLFFCCSTDNEEIYSYHQFPGKTWKRFDNIIFDIKIRNDGIYDVSLEAVHTLDFERELFIINMIMNTPSGEERINEYSYKVKNNIGKFRGNCAGDSCRIIIPLNEKLQLKAGDLRLEIENLIPYIETEGLKGIGIRLVPRG